MIRFSSLTESVFRPLRSLQPALGLTTVALAAAFFFGSPTTTAAQQRLCDTAFEDCRDPLITSSATRRSASTSRSGLWKTTVIRSD